MEVIKRGIFWFRELNKYIFRLNFVDCLNIKDIKDMVWDKKLDKIRNGLSGHYKLKFVKVIEG